MTHLPINLMLVRHGFSEGNMAVKGVRFDGSPVGHIPAEFYSRHDSLMRLSEAGEYQAGITGEWLRKWAQKNTTGNFDRFFVSPHVRTRETAYHLALNGNWSVDDRWRERDWGRIGHMPRSVTEEQFPGTFAAKSQNEWYWRPPSGESLATDVRSRLTSALEDMQQPPTEQAVIAVTHGELIRVAEFVLEHMTPEDWLAHDENDHYSVRNCMVLHYTRENPDTGDIADNYTHRRGIVPWDEELSWDGGEWTEISPRTFSDEELFNTVQEYPRLLGIDD